MIFGERVRFSAVERTDIPFFVKWLNDPEVLDGLSLYLPMSLVDEEAWFESMVKSDPAQHPLAIEIKPTAEWMIIGDCGFHDIDWHNRAAELGIFIGEKRYWNQGFGAESVRLLLKHGFNTLNMNRIWLQVHANNPRAIRSYEKVGFIHEGRKREAIYKDGQFYDMLLMSVLRSEWKPVPLGGSGI